MTAPLIPTSRELVRSTREAWGQTKREFGKTIGVSGEFAGRVEHGLQVFSERNIEDGCAHPNTDARAFWLAYRTARRHELDVAIIENCFGTAA
jgi:hypothetical protein